MPPLSDKQSTYLKANLFVPAELIESLTKEQASEIIGEFRQVMNDAPNILERHTAKAKLSMKVRNKFAKRSCRYCGKDTDGANSETKCCC